MAGLSLTATTKASVSPAPLTKWRPSTQSCRWSWLRRWPRRLRNKILQRMNRISPPLHSHVPRGDRVRPSTHLTTPCPTTNPWSLSMPARPSAASPRGSGSTRTTSPARPTTAASSCSSRHPRRRHTSSAFSTESTRLRLKDNFKNCFKSDIFWHCRIQPT